jgi:hypothetical protein
MGIGDATEGLIFARWALDGVSDPDNVSLRLARLWNSRLTIDERRQLVDVVAQAMAADHVPSAGQRAAILHLTKRLALTA